MKKSICSFTKIIFVTVLVCAGLYPQVAIADDNNTYIADQEQIFHSKDKNFLIIHPTSYFSYKPKSLEPAGKEQPDPLQPTKKRLVSHRHQLLAYHSLLETAKPYLIMPCRVPALQSALLFSSELDTSGTCQTIIADKWLEFRIHQVRSNGSVAISFYHASITRIRVLYNRKQFL